MEVRAFRLWGAYYVRVKRKKEGKPGLVDLFESLSNLSLSLEIPFNFVFFDGFFLMVFRGFAS